jgi:hypothetical protein
MRLFVGVLVDVFVPEATREPFISSPTGDATT